MSAKKIRIWKLGSLEYRIFPSEEAARRLNDILTSFSAKHDDEIQDIIWGPDLEVLEVGVDDAIEDYVVEKMETSSDGKYVTIVAQNRNIK